MGDSDERKCVESPHSGKGQMGKGMKIDLDKENGGPWYVGWGGVGVEYTDMREGKKKGMANQNSGGEILEERRGPGKPWPCQGSQ